MNRLCAMAIGIVLFNPLSAVAQANCEDARAIRGNVQSVILSEGDLRTATGAIRTPLHPRETLTFSRDRTAITITDHDSEAQSVCEFDTAGKLLRTRRKANGATIEWTEMRTYDEQGRLVRVESDNLPDRVLTYTYSGNARTARHPAHNPITTTTERDELGRVIRETRRDHGEDQDSVVTYRYGPGTVETTGRDHDKTWHTLSQLDAMGNAISSSSVPDGVVVNTTYFEYDAEGNWIKRVQPLPPTGLSRVETRQIVYFR